MQRDISLVRLLRLLDRGQSTLYAENVNMKSGMFLRASATSNPVSATPKESAMPHFQPLLLLGVSFLRNCLGFDRLNRRKDGVVVRDGRSVLLHLRSVIGVNIRFDCVKYVVQPQLAGKYRAFMLHCTRTVSHVTMDIKVCRLGRS